MRLFITHYNKVFWGLFLVAVVIMMTSIFGSLPLLDVLLALVLIVIALHKVEEDILHGRLKTEKTDMNVNLRRMNHLLGNHYHFTRSLRDVHEFRLHNMDIRRAELDARVEQKYREIVRKIINIENELNRISRAVKGSKRKKL